MYSLSYLFSKEERQENKRVVRDGKEGTARNGKNTFKKSFAYKIKNFH